MSSLQVLLHALDPTGAPATELPQLLADVQSLLLLADVYRENEAGHEGAEPIMRAADHGVMDTLERAKKLQRAVLEKLRGEMEGWVRDPHTHTACAVFDTPAQRAAP